MFIAYVIQVDELERAFRKRSYEVTNATKRRKADEDGVLSWWKGSLLFLSIYVVYLSHIQLTVDELQPR